MNVGILSPKSGNFKKTDEDDADDEEIRKTDL